VSIPLTVIEHIIDSSGAAPAIEALLPAGARHRQLTTRTLLTGMMLALADRRPAFLTEAHRVSRDPAVHAALLLSGPRARAWPPARRHRPGR
jgi:hypothetical protein